MSHSCISDVNTSFKWFLFSEPFQLKPGPPERLSTTSIHLSLTTKKSLNLTDIESEYSFYFSQFMLCIMNNHVSII